MCGLTQWSKLFPVIPSRPSTSQQMLATKFGRLFSQVNVVKSSGLKSLVDLRVDERVKMRVQYSHRSFPLQTSNFVCSDASPYFVTLRYNSLHRRHTSYKGLYDVSVSSTSPARSCILSLQATCFMTRRVGNFFSPRFLVRDAGCGLTVLHTGHISGCHWSQRTRFPQNCALHLTGSAVRYEPMERYDASTYNGELCVYLPASSGVSRLRSCSSGVHIRICIDLAHCSRGLAIALWVCTNQTFVRTPHLR